MYRAEGNPVRPPARGPDVSAFARYSWLNGLATDHRPAPGTSACRVRQGPLASRPDDVLIGTSIRPIGFRLPVDAGPPTATRQPPAKMSWRSHGARRSRVILRCSRSPSGSVIRAGRGRRARYPFGVRMQLIL